MEPHLFVGIDVSKGYADFAAQDHHRKSKGRTIKLDDTSSGHAQSLEWIVKKADLVRQSPTDSITISCGVESTGGYERNWLAALSAAALQMLVDNNIILRVARLNPRLVSASRKAENQRNYSDETSAYAIATYLDAFSNQVVYQDCFAPHGAERGRPIFNEIKGLTKANTAERNRLQAELQAVFPQLIAYLKGNLGQQAWQLLSIYPTAKSLREAKGKVSKKAGPLAPVLRKVLVEKCDYSDASFVFDSTISRNSIKRSAKRILSQNQELKAVKKSLVELIDDNRVEQLCSIPGIGVYSACALLIEIGDINRFADASKLVAYFGLHPSIKESGDFKGKTKLSKRGSSTARSILYICAGVGKRHCSHLGNIAAEKYSQGRKHVDVVCIVAHKMLRVIYGMLTSGTLYDPGIDVANGARKAPSKVVSGAKTVIAENEPLEQGEIVSNTESDESVGLAKKDLAPLSNHERRKRKAVST